MASPEPPFRNPSRDFLHLRPLGFSDLPPHPSILAQAPVVQDAGPPIQLGAFVREVLEQGMRFADGEVPERFVERGKKSGVAVLKASRGAVRTAGKGGARREYWFARRSRHEDRRGDGTASFEEFGEGLRVGHSRNEMEYTPGVFDAWRVLEWDLEDAEIEGFRDVEMAVYEMCHHLPFPLRNRTFPVLVLAATTSPASFIIVQLPLDLATFPSAIFDQHVLYANGLHRRVCDAKRKRKRVLTGMYVSVERVKLAPPEGDECGKILWEMATASDARGWLPMWVQKLGVPGAISKDVGFFLKWVAGKREVG